MRRHPASYTDNWSGTELHPGEEDSRQVPPRLASLVLGGMGAAILIFLVWAGFSQLDEVTTGTGRVIPSRKLQVVQNLEGGILREILVNEGDIVKPEQVLLRLDDTAVTASYGENRAKYLSLMATTTRLAAEIDGQEAVFPSEVTTERPDFAEGERQLRLARAVALESELAVLRQQLSQRQQEATELRERLAGLTRSHGLVQREYDMTAPLLNSGAVSKIEVVRLERQVNDLKRDLEATRLAMPRAESAIAESRNKIQERQNAFLSEARRELTQKRSEMAGLQEAASAIKDRVTRTEVRSPVRGTVQQVKIRTLGGVIAPGMDLIEIVPLDDQLLIEALIKPGDIAFVRPEQEALIKFTAYDYSVYGGLKGRLVRISADTVEQEGESFFKIELRTDKTYLGEESSPLPIIPGMVTTVQVLTGKKSILDYLLKPIRKARESALREH